MEYNAECRHCTQELPKRTADTMSDAIAIASPEGRMSKRAAHSASARLHTALFGGYDFNAKHVPTAREQAATLRQSAANLRELAARGMSQRKFTKDAERLEVEAARLENKS